MTLDTAMQRDSRRPAALLQWVRYSASGAIQLEAIALAHLLSARMPGLLVDLLLNAPASNGVALLV